MTCAYRRIQCYNIEILPSREVLWRFIYSISTEGNHWIAIHRAHMHIITCTLSAYFNPLTLFQNTIHLGLAELAHLLRRKNARKNC